jgi:hypothetical protein
MTIEDIDLGQQSAMTCAHAADDRTLHNRPPHYRLPSTVYSLPSAA